MAATNNVACLHKMHSIDVVALQKCTNFDHITYIPFFDEGGTDVLAGKCAVVADQFARSHLLPNFQNWGAVDFNF